MALTDRKPGHDLDRSFFLALGMTAVVFLTSDILFKGLWAAVTSALIAGGFAWFWYGLPLSRRT